MEEGVRSPMTVGSWSARLATALSAVTRSDNASAATRLATIAFLLRTGHVEDIMRKGHGGATRVEAALLRKLGAARRSWSAKEFVPRQQRRLLQLERTPDAPSSQINDHHATT